MSSEATKKSEQFLLSFLDESQADDWRQYKSFEVDTPAGHRYRLTSSSVVPLWPPASHSYCLLPRDTCLPVADQVLARMLLLQSDECRFLALANRVFPPFAGLGEYRMPEPPIYAPDPNRIGGYTQVNRPTVLHDHGRLNWSMFDDGRRGVEMTIELWASDLDRREDREDWHLDGVVHLHNGRWRITAIDVATPFAGPLALFAGLLTFTLILEERE